MATTEIASTKTSMIAMPMKILDAADGLRLKALMTAYPRTAMTTDGPMTAMNMTVIMINVSANMPCPSLLRPKTSVWGLRRA